MFLKAEEYLEVYLNPEVLLEVLELHYQDMNFALKNTHQLAPSILNFAFLKKDHFLALKTAGINWKMCLKETVLKAVLLEVRIVYQTI